MLPTVATTVEAVVAAPRAALFAWFVPLPLPRILLGYGPIGAVAETTGQTGPWSAPGSRRTVHLADGSTAQETVTACEAPGYFAYRVSDFTHPLLRLLARDAVGEWWFGDAPPAAGAGGAPAGRGAPATRVVWRYTFRARSRAAAAALRVVSAVVWRGYMRVGLGATKTLGEREAGPAGASGAGVDRAADRTGRQVRDVPIPPAAPAARVR